MNWKALEGNEKHHCLFSSLQCHKYRLYLCLAPRLLAKQHFFLYVFLLLEDSLPLSFLKLYCKLFLSPHPNLCLLSHTHTFEPLLLPPCVWERQCLHTTGTQGGCLGNPLTHSQWKTTALTVVKSSRNSFSAGTDHIVIQLPMTPFFNLSNPPSILKCLLFKKGTLAAGVEWLLSLSLGRLMVS